MMFVQDGGHMTQMKAVCAVVVSGSAQYSYILAGPLRSACSEGRAQYCRADTTISVFLTSSSHISLRKQIFEARRFSKDS